MTLIDRMINYFREGENLYLESRTEMAEYTEKQRQKFYIHKKLKDFVQNF